MVGALPAPPREQHDENETPKAADQSMHEPLWRLRYHHVHVISSKPSHCPWASVAAPVAKLFDRTWLWAQTKQELPCRPVKITACTQASKRVGSVDQVLDGIRSQPGRQACARLPNVAGVPCGHDLHEVLAQ